MADSPQHQRNDKLHKALMSGHVVGPNSANAMIWHWHYLLSAVKQSFPNT